MDQLYIRAGNLPANSDIRMYDHANIDIAVGGHTVSDVIIGELWASYDVELLLPRSSETIGANLLYNATIITGASNAVPLGISNTTSPPSTFSVDITGSILTLPTYLAGQFQLSLIYTTTTTFGTTFPVAPTVTPSAEIEIFEDQGYIGQVFSLVTQGSFVRRFLITTYGTGGNLSFAGDGIILSGGTITMFVELNQIPIPNVSGKIIDFQGKNRSKKYKEFMSKAILPPPETSYEEIRFVEPYSLQTNNKYNRVALKRLGLQPLYHEVNDTTFEQLTDQRTSDATVKLICSQLMNVQHARVENLQHR